MSDTLVQIDGAPRPPMDPREIARIALNLTAVCAIGALILVSSLRLLRRPLPARHPRARLRAPYWRCREGSSRPR